jgi:hypothetical protein
MSDNSIDTALASIWAMTMAMTIMAILWFPVMIYPAAALTVFLLGALLWLGPR